MIKFIKIRNLFFSRLNLIFILFNILIPNSEIKSQFTCNFNDSIIFTIEKGFCSVLLDASNFGLTKPVSNCPGTELKSIQLLGPDQKPFKNRKAFTPGIYNFTWKVEDDCGYLINCFFDLIVRFPDGIANCGQVIAKSTPLHSMCGNGDFENGLLDNTEWQGKYGSSNSYPILPNGFSMAIPLSNDNANQTILPSGIDPIVGISTSAPFPASNNFSIRLGNRWCNFGQESLIKEFIVQPGNSILSFWYSCVFQNSSHLLYDQNGNIILNNQPGFEVILTAIPSLNNISSLVDLGNGGNFIFPGTTDAFWLNGPTVGPIWTICDGGKVVYKDWSCVEIDLSDYVNQIVQIEFRNRDCTAGAHFGYTYLDNLCLKCPCSILTGEAWYDQNGDGIFQQIENGINGLNIELVDVMTGQVVSTTHTITKPGTSSDDGYYEFPCVKPGMYFVRFDSIPGFTTSTPFQGGNAETDSDITGTYGPYTTYKITVAIGDTINNIDGGYKDSTSVNMGHLTIAGLIISETTKAMLPSRVNLATVNNSNYKTEWSHYSGNYAFSDLTAGQDYRISVENNESPLQGVSTRDIVLIQKHILGIKYLDSPYKIIAADVNSSQSITASDLAEIRKLILGVIETFPKNKSWRFIPKNYVFKNPTYPFPFEENILHSKMENNKMNTDFYAVKIGDVSGNALGIVNTITRSIKNVQLIFEKASYKKNEEISVPVRISEGDMLSGIQIALQFSEELEFVTIEKGSLNINQENYRINRGQLLISYNEARGFDVGKKDIFTLKLKAKTDLNIDKKINSSNLLENEAYDLADQVVTLEVISSVENIKTTSGVYKFYPAKPNPFKQETMIEFELPNEEAIIFTVYNPEGKLVWSKEKIYISGNNQMSISKEDLGHSGLYYLHIQSKEFCKTQRILMLD